MNGIVVWAWMFWLPHSLQDENGIMIWVWTLCLSHSLQDDRNSGLGMDALVMANYIVRLLCAQPSELRATFELKRLQGAGRPGISDVCICAAKLKRKPLTPNPEPQTLSHPHPQGLAKSVSKSWSWSFWTLFHRLSPKLGSRV